MSVFILKETAKIRKNLPKESPKHSVMPLGWKLMSDGERFISVRPNGIPGFKWFSQAEAIKMAWMQVENNPDEVFEPLRDDVKDYVDKMYPNFKEIVLQN
jgi:hypothetical protein